MARPRIVVDQNIPFAPEALGRLADVVTLPGAAINAAAVKGADLLWVRSTVRVGPALLDGSKVRFVATATIGTDHLDIPWLESRKIAWAAAPGSNAASVQLWWAAALCTIAERRRTPLGGLRVGIVGVGNVGRKVEAFAAALGCEVLRCDPPRARAEGPEGFISVDALCQAADVVTLHVPLVREGPDATFHLLDAVRLAAVRDGTIVVNASRGDALDGAALLAQREAKALTLALDVYEGEPAPSPALVAAAALATPHVAGHSIDGKASGTKMIYDATCAFLGVRPQWEPRRHLPPPPVRVLSVAVARDLSDEAVVLKVLSRFYRITEDDAAMRQIAAMPDGDRGDAFQRYRNQYPVHREPAGLQLELRPMRPRVTAALATLGVQIVQR